jgi:hypothetical protein
VSPFAGVVPNHLMLHWLKTVVVSDEEKAPVVRGQVGIGKASASEPLRKCRERLGDIRTGATLRPWDESGGCGEYWPGGVRHVGGASPICGLCMERGKAGADTACPAQRGGQVIGSAPSGVETVRC